MKKNPLLGALPIIATMLGQKLGVKVVIGGGEASTDGQVIVLPSLPADGDPTLAVLAHGFIDHEAAHIRFTDFQAGKPSGLTGLIANLLEDVRIERRLGERFPGSRHNLAALVEQLESQRSIVPPTEAPVAQQVGAALSALLRARLLGQAGLAAAADTLEARIDGLLPPGVLTKLLALAFEVRNAASTAEVISLARRIVALLEEEAHPPTAGDPSDLGSMDARSDADGADADGTDADGADADGTDADGADGAGDADGAGQQGGANGAGDADGASQQGNADGAGAGSADAGRDDARRAALAELLAAEGDEADEADVGVRAGQLLRGHARAVEGQAVRVADLDPVPANGDSQKAVADARAATASLRRRLGVLVESRQRGADWRSRRGRRLDPAELYRPAVGQSIRFVRQDEWPAPNTALALLLDRSGSMRGELPLAGQAVLSILLALDTLPGVASWAAAFPGSADDRVVPLKAFEEQAHRVAGRFALAAGGGTPLANALWRAGGELLQRPEPRRLVVVATDGQPDNLDGVSDILARCRASGIEVVGLGIGQSLDHVQAVFGVRHAVSIATIEALAPALFAVLERQLLA